MAVIKDRTVIITGAASGIGRALAHHFARHGARLALWDQNLAELKQTACDIQAYQDQKISLHNVDISSRTQVCEEAKSVLSIHGGVDILVNNAGISLSDYFDGSNLDEFKKVMDVNFWGAVYLCHAFLPSLKKSNHARIINVSSVYGLFGMESQTAYCSSKFAIRGFTEALKMELSEDSIHIATVYPGGVKTNIVKNATVRCAIDNKSHAELQKDFEEKITMTADEAARQLIDGILKNKNRIVIGKQARFADILVRSLPNTYYSILKKMLLRMKQRLAKKTPILVTEKVN
tara:strand:- start:726 stop:1595 length:870 start_codon:yes stop_codon:yes gene_type:complete